MKKSTVYGTLGVLGMGTGVILGAHVLDGEGDETTAFLSGSRIVAPDKYVPSRELRQGRNLTMVLVTASWCIGTSYEGFPEATRSVKLALQQRAEDAGMGFNAIAVAIDWNVERGVEYLRNLGEFDEIIVGRNWINSGLDRYVYQFHHSATVPQIVVVVEEVQHDPFDYKLGASLTTRVGADEIVDWASSGAPIELESYLGDAELSRGTASESPQ
jgi:hypothetical protein